MKKKERIELHCHSKLGGFAAMDPRRLIKYLSRRGMPAFAITDESTIAAYSELEREWEQLFCGARPIFGMEVMGKTTNEEVEHMSVLIKNETGKETLYKLISENKSEDPHPLFSFEKFIENREGLLLGSGTAKGRLYKSAMKGASKEELKNIISVYDYVEVLPGKMYEEINKTIIVICHELKIPVVAVSDGRYGDEYGREALKIIQCWRNETEELPDCHFWSTEEMLSAFDYLPEEKAFEIVVANTHLIADMCKTVKIRPKVRYPLSRPDAGYILREKCYKGLEHKYPDASKEIIDRLEEELEALSRTAMETYILAVKELLEKTSLSPWDIQLKGTSAGSIVLYLLNISEVDPLKYNLAPETIFGVDGTEEIDIDIDIPANRQLEIIDRTDEIEGVGNHVWAGYIGGIGFNQKKEMIKCYEQKTGHSLEPETFAKIWPKIIGNSLWRQKLPGRVLLIPNGRDCTEAFPTAMAIGGYEVAHYIYHYTNGVFDTISLLPGGISEMLSELKKLTGVDLQDVPTDSKEVIDLIKVDSEGELPGLGSSLAPETQPFKKIVEVLHPSSFNDIVKIYALSHGTFEVKEFVELMPKEKGVSSSDIIGTHDDVFDFNLSLGIERKMAYEIAQAVGKEYICRDRAGSWETWKQTLLDAGAPDWYIWSCEHIQYLFPRAHCISHMLAVMRLGWFKVHYPSEFNKVMKECDERHLND